MKGIVVKIKLFTLLTSVLVVLLLSLGVYSNLRSAATAPIVNISGKQRMLSQKIKFELFSSPHSAKIDELTKEYESNLAFLRAQTAQFVQNRSIVDLLETMDKTWRTSKDLMASIRSAGKTGASAQWQAAAPSGQDAPAARDETPAAQGKTPAAQNFYGDFFKISDDLLQLANLITYAYQDYFHRQKDTVALLQFLLGLAAFLLMIFIVNKTRSVQRHFERFIKKTQDLSNFKSQENSPTVTTGEKELDKIGTNISNFVNKMEHAAAASSQAILYAQEAIKKINATLELLDEKPANKEILISEDMAIQSSDELLKAIEILRQLQDNLSKLKDG
ncbi:MAG: type IV pili methyl-accepting chemotaxis transducer N-terminal domain-containing protein [Helicobacteraceae bacterium]